MLASFWQSCWDHSTRTWNSVTVQSDTLQSIAASFGTWPGQPLRSPNSLMVCYARSVLSLGQVGSVGVEGLGTAPSRSRMVCYHAAFCHSVR